MNVILVNKIKRWVQTAKSEAGCSHTTAPPRIEPGSADFQSTLLSDRLTPALDTKREKSTLCNRIKANESEVNTLQHVVNCSAIRRSLETLMRSLMNSSWLHKGSIHADGNAIALLKNRFGSRCLVHAMTISLLGYRKPPIQSQICKIH